LGVGRNINLTNVPGHENLYKLNAWSHGSETYIKIESDATGNIEKVILEDSGIAINVI